MKLITIYNLTEGLFSGGSNHRDNKQIVARITQRNIGFVG
jgi:hypothetical protein